MANLVELLQRTQMARREQNPLIAGGQNAQAAMLNAFSDPKRLMGVSSQDAIIASILGAVGGSAMSFMGNRQEQQTANAEDMALAQALSAKDPYGQASQNPALANNPAVLMALQDRQREIARQDEETKRAQMQQALAIADSGLQIDPNGNLVQNPRSLAERRFAEEQSMNKQKLDLDRQSLNLQREKLNAEKKEKGITPSMYATANALTKEVENVPVEDVVAATILQTQSENERRENIPAGTQTAIVKQWGSYTDDKATTAYNSLGLLSDTLGEIIKNGDIVSGGSDSYQPTYPIPGTIGVQEFGSKAKATLLGVLNSEDKKAAATSKYFAGMDTARSLIATVNTKDLKPVSDYEFKQAYTNAINSTTWGDIKKKLQKMKQNADKGRADYEIVKYVIGKTNGNPLTTVTPSAAIALYESVLNKKSSKEIYGKR